METLATRVRVTGASPRYQYRLYAPFPALSPERQSLIHYHSDFGHGRGLLARMTEVIAPMSWLVMPPGLEKAAQGRAIHELAAAIEATVLSAIFPEMTASPVPLLFAHPEELPDAHITAVVADIMGRFVRLTADAAALDHLDPRRA